MTITKNQRFGIITLITLMVASYLVTTEPWKRSSREMSTTIDPETPPANITIDWKNLASGYPMTTTADTILSYTGFDLGYNERFEQAAWVAYVLTKEEAENETSDRTGNFRPDTLILTGSATLGDYRGSGFDRGHLAPAGDMRWSLEAMSQSFLMSNMSPQRPAFNRGVWLRLENQVREWAIEKDSLYVISGPVLNSIDTLIGENDVGVPSYFFKVLVDLSPPDHDMIAFLLPNTGSSGDLMQFGISVDSLEQVTGYDFFSKVPDQEAISWLERQFDPARWN